MQRLILLVCGVSLEEIYYFSDFLVSEDFYNATFLLKNATRTSLVDFEMMHYIHIKRHFFIYLLVA